MKCSAWGGCAGGPEKVFPGLQRWLCMTPTTALVAGSTGHAHHFLQRLDRLSRPHLEIALALYRAPEVIGFALAHAGLPSRAGRVAISLDHPDLGPFLIVTRDRRFVTCLGEGMGHGHPVITRTQLEGAFACIAILCHRPLASVRPAAPHGCDPHAPCPCGSGRRRKRYCGVGPPR
jgi:hypothetical protein